MQKQVGERQHAPSHQVQSQDKHHSVYQYYIFRSSEPLQAPVLNFEPLNIAQKHHRAKINQSGLTKRRCASEAVEYDQHLKNST